MSTTLVLTNGRIYTQDKRKPFVSAVAICDETVIAVGSDDDMVSLLANGGEQINLDGRCVTPGLVDAHVHFQGYALNLSRIDLSHTLSLEECQDRISDHLTSNDSGSWLLGRGWNQSDWPGQEFPTAADLNLVSGHRPVLLHHRSGHAAWANSRALEIAGIDRNSPDPPGGRIGRDDTGDPTGILFETAISLAAKVIPKPNESQIVQAMRTAQIRCLESGLTGLHDFDGRSCLKALQVMKNRGDLRLRVVKNLPVKLLDHAVGIGLQTGFGGSRIRIGSVKMFADGALGPRTAAMIQPYEDDYENRGMVVTSKNEMLAKVLQASEHGISSAIHAIGDRANRIVLDVFADVRKAEQERQGGTSRTSSMSLRHRIEHAQIVHPDDFQRFKSLNIIASMQPIHATSDRAMADSLWGSRTQYAYAWKRFTDQNVRLVFGSDAPVEPIEPLSGIHAAATRKVSGPTSANKTWHPELCLEMDDIIWAYSLGPAYASMQENQLGSISPGKLADMTIFSRDIFSMPPDELLDVKIEGTVVGGRVEHRTW